MTIATLCCAQCCAAPALVRKFSLVQVRPESQWRSGDGDFGGRIMEKVAVVLPSVGEVCVKVSRVQEKAFLEAVCLRE